MRITVIGLGYVGLTTALCFARLGHAVVGVDISRDKVMTLCAGGLPIWEPELDDLLQQAKAEQSIRFTTDLADAISTGEMLFICVGTPAGTDGMPDLTQVWNLVHPIAAHAREDTVVVIKSTVPVGTTEALGKWLDHLSGGKGLECVHNPEFLRQGSAVKDFLHPDRIVIGTGSRKAEQQLRELYRDVPAPVISCDFRSAELIKYAANGFLAMKISYANMIAQLCEGWGGNVEAVMDGIGSDHRIGPSHLHPGVGFGGSCFPKDTAALLAMGRSTGCSMPLIQALREINADQPRRLIRRMEEILGSLEGKHIGLLGLTFKPHSDDLREAPSLTLSALALEKGAVVKAYDPLVRQYPLAEVQLASNPHQLMETCDAVLLVTEWEEFRQLDWGRLVIATGPCCLWMGGICSPWKKSRRGYVNILSSTCL